MGDAHLWYCGGMHTYGIVGRCTLMVLWGDAHLWYCERGYNSWVYKIAINMFFKDLWS